MSNIFTTFETSREMINYLSGASLDKFLVFMEDAIVYFDKASYMQDPCRFITTASSGLRNLNIYSTESYERDPRYKTAVNKLILNLMTVVDADKVPEFLWTVIFDLTEIVSDLNNKDKITCLFDAYTKRHGSHGYSLLVDVLKKRNIGHTYQVHLANLCFDYDFKHRHHLNMLDLYLDIHKRCAHYIYTHNDDLSYKILAATNSPEFIVEYPQSKTDKIHKKLRGIIQFKYQGTYDKYLNTAKLLDMTENVDFWKNSYLSTKLTYSDRDISTLEFL